MTVSLRAREDINHGYVSTKVKVFFSYVTAGGVGFGLGFLFTPSALPLLDLFSTHMGGVWRELGSRLISCI